MTNTPLPPTSASPRYLALFNTAVKFLHAQVQNPELPSRMDFDRIRALCAADFQHSWGHNYAVSIAPPLQGTHAFDGFVSHLQSMLPKLESWENNITDVLVDEVQMKVMLRITFYMRPKGANEEDAVENDLLWQLEMSDEVGGEAGEVKIRKSIEFVDGIAANKLKEALSR